MRLALVLGALVLRALVLLALVFLALVLPAPVLLALVLLAPVLLAPVLLLQIQGKYITSTSARNTLLEVEFPVLVAQSAMISEICAIDIVRQFFACFAKKLAPAGKN